MIVLEYGTEPGVARPASVDEVLDVVRRGKLDFVEEIIAREHISDLAVYSTFHVDCAP